jgi:hypothetical protein
MPLESWSCLRNSGSWTWPSKSRRYRRYRFVEGLRNFPGQTTDSWKLVETFIDISMSMYIYYTAQYNMFPMLFHLHPQFCCSNPISTYPGMEASDCFAWVILDFCRPISKRTWLGVQKWGLGVSKSKRVDWIVYSYFATCFFGSWAYPFFRTIRDPRLQNLQRKGEKTPQVELFAESFFKLSMLRRLEEANIVMTNLCQLGECQPWLSLVA